MVSMDASLELWFSALFCYGLDLFSVRLAHGARLHLVVDDEGSLSLRGECAKFDGGFDPSCHGSPEDGVSLERRHDGALPSHG